MRNRKTRREKGGERRRHFICVGKRGFGADLFVFFHAAEGREAESGGREDRAAAVQFVRLERRILQPTLPASPPTHVNTRH